MGIISYMGDVWDATTNDYYDGGDLEKLYIFIHIII